MVGGDDAFCGRSPDIGDDGGATVMMDDRDGECGKST